MLNSLSLKSRFTLSFNNIIRWQRVRKLYYHSLFFLLYCTRYNIAVGIFVRGPHLELIQDRYFVTVAVFQYVRQAHRIVESGNRPRVDAMRHAPDGMDNTQSPN